MLSNESMKQDPLIRRAWKNNQLASTILISIPTELAAKHNIRAGNNLLMLDTKDGILIKRLELMP